MLSGGSDEGGEGGWCVFVCVYLQFLAGVNDMCDSGRGGRRRLKRR